MDTYDRVVKRRSSAVDKFSRLKGHVASKERRDKYGREKIAPLRMAGEIWKDRSSGRWYLGFANFDDFGPDNTPESREPLDVAATYITEQILEG